MNSIEKCPKCGKNTVDADPEGACPKLGVSMCGDPYCEGGVLIHVPKGAGPTEYAEAVLELEDLTRRMQAAATLGVVSAMYVVINRAREERGKRN